MKTYRGLLAVFIALAAVPAMAEEPAADAKVDGLNTPVFAVLHTIRTRNTGALKPADAQLIAAAIMHDGTVDPAERDLLNEMVQTEIRTIWVTRQGAAADEPKVMMFQAVGDARKPLEDVLHPSDALYAIWAKPDHGWPELLAEAGQSEQARKRVIDFAAAQLGPAVQESGAVNGWKPLREKVVELYRIANDQKGEDMVKGRTLLHEIMQQIDRNSLDLVPEFLYNWVRPPQPPGS